MKFTLAPQNREQTVGHTLRQFHLQLKMAAREDYFQVQLEPENDGIIEGLNATFNADRAWIIWNNAEGEWLYPVNSKHAKLESDEEDCTLENGQCDVYPIQWSHSRDRAIKVLNHYFENGQRAPWLEWTSEEYWMD